MTVRDRLPPPPPATFSTFSQVAQYVRRLLDSVRIMYRGKLECVTTVTLTASAASTTLNFKGLSPQSVVCFDPQTANAAAELYGATMYVATADRGNDSWTITHANNAQTDRTFSVSVLG